MSDEREARHPMAVVVARTGLTPDALRVWERRYGVVAPGRGPGGHRLYSDADVERLRLLRAATEGGRRIGDVARLSDGELSRLVEEDRRSAPRPGAPAGDPSLELVERGLERVRALDSAGLEAELRRALALLGVRAFIDDVVVPLLHAIGDGWEEGAVTIAQEHMASALVQDVLVEVMRAHAGRGGAERAGRLLLATPSGERHAIGALLAGVVAATAGWDVVDLGADLPASEIAAAALQSGADLVALSVTTPAALDEVRAARALVPGAVRIVAGGAGLADQANALREAGVSIAADVAEFEALLASLPRPVTGAAAAAAARRRT